MKNRKPAPTKQAKKNQPLEGVKKSPTGIAGFDEITGGGVPEGRPTLVCGSAGCGKSLFASEFLVRGIVEYGEPGVLLTFDETTEDITKNVASLGFDIAGLVARKKLVVDHIRVERNEIEENGEYDLEGLFIRLALAIETVGAKRVVLDTIESLFSSFGNQAILRAELRRLFDWLKDRGMTTVITGERGEGQLTRQGIEEYISDCVILLDHRVIGQISTRRLRVVKYRGTLHGTNEYPFLIDEKGITVMPITSSGMDYEVSNKRISSGVRELDEMMGGKGYYKGSSILLSGTAGTGKTSLAAHLAEATCARGERCMYFCFEESQAQIIRNMRSIGINLEPYVQKGLLKFHSTRPTVHGLEMHLLIMHKMVEQFKPSVVIVDPVSNLQAAGTMNDSSSMLIRLVDFLRKRHITGFYLNLTSGGEATESTDQGLSSMVDTWLLLRDVELGGERNRVMYLLKSRGMAHSNQLREFLFTSKGVRLVPAYVGPAGVLTGSARLSQEATEKTTKTLAQGEVERRRLLLERQRQTVEAKILELRAEFASENADFDRMLRNYELNIEQVEKDRLSMEASRQVRS